MGNSKECGRHNRCYLISERAEPQDGEEDSDVEMSVRSTRSGSWGGYRIPRSEEQGGGEQGRLSMTENAAAIAARIAGMAKMEC
jgi:hypothetical protein